MPSPRYATLVRTCQPIDIEPSVLTELFQLARRLCPAGFPADETRTLDAMRAHVSLALVEMLRSQLAARLALPEKLFSLDRFTIQGCGPVSLHDDRHNYPGMYFVLIVVHSGRLGLVDKTSQAQRHTPGEIVLLDPQRKHALVAEGLYAKDQRCAPADTVATEELDQFMFFDFEVARAPLRDRFLQLPRI